MHTCKINKVFPLSFHFPVIFSAETKGRNANDGTVLILIIMSYRINNNVLILSLKTMKNNEFSFEIVNTAHRELLLLQLECEYEAGQRKSGLLVGHRGATN